MLMDVRSKRPICERAVRVMRTNAHASYIKTSESLFSDLINQIIVVRRERMSARCSRIH